MEPNYFNSTWTQSGDCAPPVHEYTERTTFVYNYERPSLGSENFGQGPPNHSATQDTMQTGSGFYVPPGASSRTNIYSGGPRLQGYSFLTPGIYTHTSNTVGPTHNSHGPNILDSLHELQQVPNIQLTSSLPYDSSSLFGPHYSVDRATYVFPNTEYNSPSSLFRSAAAGSVEAPLLPYDHAEEFMSSSSGVNVPLDPAEEALADLLFPELTAQISYYHSLSTGHSSSSSVAPHPATTGDPFTDREYAEFGMQPALSMSNSGGDPAPARGSEITVEEISAEGVQTRLDVGEMPTTRSTASYTSSPSSVSTSPFFPSTSVSTSTTPASSTSNSPFTQIHSPLHLPTATTQTPDGKYLCPCGVSIKRELDFHRHMQTVHVHPDGYTGEAVPRIVCGHEGCGTTFSRRDALQRHVKEGKHGRLPRGKAKGKRMDRERMRRGGAGCWVLKF